MVLWPIGLLVVVVVVFFFIVVFIFVFIFVIVIIVIILPAVSAIVASFPTPVSFLAPSLLACLLVISHAPSLGLSFAGIIEALQAIFVPFALLFHLFFSTLCCFVVPFVAQSLADDLQARLSSLVVSFNPLLGFRDASPLLAFFRGAHTPGFGILTSVSFAGLPGFLPSAASALSVRSDFTAPPLFGVFGI